MTDRVLLADGTSFLLLADGTSKLLLAAAASGTVTATATGTTTTSGSATGASVATTIGVLTVTIEVSFTTNPLAVPIWENITGDVLGLMDIKTGRWSQAQDGYDPGTLTVTLDNHDRKYDPFNVSGPYYGNLKPRKRIRVRAVYNGVIYDLFTGFIDGWPQTTFQPPASAEITVGATDLLGFLSNTNVRSVYADVIEAGGPIYWYRLGDEDVAVDSARGYDGTYQIAASTARGPALINGDNGAGLQVPGSSDVADRGAVFYRLGRDGLPSALPITLEGWVQPEQVRSGTNGFSLITIRNAGANLTVNLNIGPNFTSNLWFLYGGKVAAGTYTTVDSSNEYDMTSAPTHVAAVIASWGITLYVNGVAVAMDAPSGFGGLPAETMDQITIGDGFLSSSPSSQVAYKLDEVAVYDRALSAAEIYDHLLAGALPWFLDLTGARIDKLLDSVGVLSHDRDIDTGLSRLSYTNTFGDVASYLRIIETTEDGALYVNHQNGGALRFVDRNQLASDPRRQAPQLTFTDLDTSTPATWDTSVWDTAEWGGGVHYNPSIQVRQSEEHVVNDVNVRWDGGTAHSTGDPSEFGVPLERTWSTVLASSGEAKIRADTLLDRYKDTAVVVDALAVDLNTGDPAAIPLVLGARIGDMTAVRFHPQTVGDPLELTAFIEGIAYTIGDGVDTWQSTFCLSLATVE